MTEAPPQPRKVKKLLPATRWLQLCVYLVCISRATQLQLQQASPAGNMLQQHHRTSVNSSVNINISRKFNEIIQTATASATASGAGSGAVTFASATAATTITPVRRKLRRKFPGQPSWNSTASRRRRLRLHPYRRNATHVTRTTTVATVSATAAALIPKMPQQPLVYHTRLHSSFQQQQKQQHVAGVHISQQQQQQKVHVVAVTPRPQQHQLPGFAVVPAYYNQQQQQQQQHRTLLGNLTQQQQQHLLIQPGRNVLVYSNLGPIPPCPPGLLAGTGSGAGAIYTQQQHFIPMRSSTTPRSRHRGKQTPIAVNCRQQEVLITPIKAAFTAAYGS